jgi:hypothetical protein
MLHLVVAFLIVNFYGVGNPPHREVAVFESQAACEQVKAATVAALEKDDRVSGYAFTCAPVEVKQPGSKS